MLRSQLLKKQIASKGAILSQNRSFHISPINLNEKPKSPMQVFFETFRSEIKKSSELKENIKALQDETGKMADSDAYKKAKEAYESAQKGSNIASKAAKQTAKVVGDAAVAAWDSPVGRVTRTTVNKTAETIDKVVEPVRNTQIYKDVADVIDDGSSTSYGGFLTKEQRQAIRERELSSGKRVRSIKSNEEAGNALVATDIKPTGPSSEEKWETFKSTTTVGKFIADMKLRWDESENGFISLIRTIFEKITGVFAETESAKVVRIFKEMDPTFKLIEFQKTLTNYIVPEVLDAYIKNDEKVLKVWLSEAPFNIWQATNKQFVEQGLFSDGKILDIRGIEVVTLKTLPPNDLPVLVVSCRAQEIHLYRKAKTGEIAAGTEENIQLSTYAMVLTRIPEDFDNDETEGWKILEFARGGSRPFH